MAGAQLCPPKRRGARPGAGGPPASVVLGGVVRANGLPGAGENNLPLQGRAGEGGGRFLTRCREVAKRLECVQLAGAFEWLGAHESGSKLRALQTLRAIGCVLLDTLRLQRREELRIVAATSGAGCVSSSGQPARALGLRRRACDTDICRSARGHAQVDRNSVPHPDQARQGCARSR